MRALTEQLYVDETETADDGLADMLDENALHQAPMPGTSMRQPTANPNGGMNGPSPAMRPMTMSGRPITGMLRLGTQSTQGGKSMETALKTARTAATARPVTTATGRFVRLGTVRNSIDHLFRKKNENNSKARKKIILSHSLVLS
jgi:tetratricopeptide repeat protein 8